MRKRKKVAKPKPIPKLEKPRSTIIRIDYETKQDLRRLRNKIATTFLERSIERLSQTFIDRGLSTAVLVGFAVKALERELEEEERMAIAMSNKTPTGQSR